MQILEHYMWFEEHLDVSLNRVMSGEWILFFKPRSEAKFQKPLSLIWCPTLGQNRQSSLY